MTLRKDKYIYYIIAAGLLLYIPLILLRDFTPTNELKYINIVDHMLKSKDWIQFRFDGALYTDKPPLYFWLVGLIRIVTGNYSLFSIGLFICVIPAIIIGIDMYKLLSDNGYKNKNAFTVVLIMYTFLYFIGSSVVIRMDILMMVFITKAVIWFYNIVEGKKDKYYVPYIYMGIGFLIKGLAAVFIPLSVVIVYLFVTKQKEKIKKLKLLKGLVIVILFVLIWIVPLVLSLGFDTAVKELLLKQTVNRAVNTKVHKRPIYYYLVNFIPNLMPWSFFFFTSIGMVLFNIKKQSKFIVYILCWIFMPFIIFSLVSSKLDIYLVPIYGAMAVITEKLLSSDYKRTKKILGIITSCIFLLFIIAAFVSKKSLDEMNPILFKLVLFYGIFSIFTSVAGIYFSIKGKMTEFVYNIAVNMMVLTTVLGASTPVVNEYIGFSKFINIINKEKIENKNLRVFAFKENEIDRMLYLVDDKDMRSFENKDALMEKRKESDIIVLVQNDDMKDLEKDYKEVYSNSKFSIIIYKKGVE